MMGLDPSSVLKYRPIEYGQHTVESNFDVCMLLDDIRLFQQTKLKCQSIIESMVENAGGFHDDIFNEIREHVQACLPVIEEAIQEANNAIDLHEAMQ
jgi:hypothetical protein